MAPDCKETTEFVSPFETDVLTIKDCTWQLGRALSHPKAFERIIKASGANLDKVSEIVLNSVRENGEGRLSDIASKLGVELSSVSRKVQKLEQDGLVERTADPSDARASRLSLTKAGEDQLCKLHIARCDIARDILQDWPDDERHQFAILLTKFHEDIKTRQESAQ